MKTGAEKFGWSKRSPKPGKVRDGRWLVGIGMAAATRNNPMQPAQCTVRLDQNGILTTQQAMTDIGTGTYTILTQIAAEMLGLSPENIRTEMGDTNYPPSSGSGGSFGANSSGSALFDACSTLRAQLAKAAGIDPGAGRIQWWRGAGWWEIGNLGEPGGTGRDASRGWHPTREHGQAVFAAILRCAFRGSGG